MRDTQQETFIVFSEYRLQSPQQSHLSVSLHNAAIIFPATDLLRQRVLKECLQI